MSHTFHIALGQCSPVEYNGYIYLSSNVNRLCSTDYQHLLIPEHRKLDIEGPLRVYTYIKSGMNVKIGLHNLSFFSNFFIYNHMAFFDSDCEFSASEFILLRKCHEFIYRDRALFQKLHHKYVFGQGKRHRHLEEVNVFSC